MNLLITTCLIAIGTGLGACTRFLLDQLSLTYLSIPSMTSIMIINIMGSFLMGFGFCWVEWRYRKDGLSRLKYLGRHSHFAKKAGLLEKDITLPLVDHFRFSQRLQRLSGFWLTGFLGGFTTFSAYSLYNHLLFQEQLWSKLSLMLITTPMVSLLFCFSGFIAFSYLKQAPN